MLLELRQVEKAYPTPEGKTAALRGVSFGVEQGSFVSVIGPSGAGKSTLLRCITGQLTPSAGEVLVEGQDMAALRGRRKRRLQRTIGMIYQDFCLVGATSAAGNVLNACLPELDPVSVLLGRFPAEKRRRAMELLEQVGLAGKEDQRADSLSGGERQRVAVARALMQGGGLLLADEPVASLDPVNAEGVLKLLKTLQTETGLTILMNSHNVAQAAACSDRIIGLRDGTVAFDGAPQALTQERLAEIYGRELGDETA